MRNDPTLAADMARLFGGAMGELSPKRVRALENRLACRPWRYAPREIAPGWLSTDESGDSHFGYPEWFRGRFWVGYQPSFLGGPTWMWGTNDNTDANEWGFASPLEAIARVEAVGSRKRLPRRGRTRKTP